MTNIAEFEDAVGASKQGHPRGLYVLFGAEMWERFSYYGMRALLVLYLTKHLRYTRGEALDVYAAYTGLVYLSPLLGGFLADRFLGQRKAILIGGSLMALGHFAMAFEPLLSLALGLLILGNGFFKPNISTMVGQLYSPNDPRRDGAYTIFYMGINLGAFFSPLVCGTLGEMYGWHFGFGAAGVGMVFGLLVFAAMQRSLGTLGYPPEESGHKHRLTAVDGLHVALLVLAGAALVALAVLPAAKIAHAAPGWTGWLLDLIYFVVLGIVMAAITAVVTTRIRPRAKTEEALEEGQAGAGDRSPAEIAVPNANRGDRHEPDESVSVQLQRVAVILIVVTFTIVFWMGFEQAGGTFTLFADEKTDRVILGKPFPASWYQSVNPLLIFVLAPLFSMLWTALGRTRLALSATAKMGLGLLLLGVGFFVMFNADRLAAKTGLVGPQWLVIVYLFNTLGELCLSPIGLSMVNKLAPVKVASLMMAIWFMSNFVANILAGKLEGLLADSGINLWKFLMLTSFIPGLILLALTPVLKKMAHGRL